ncbi:ubiquinol-cytochrome c reductase iron-sulfur subunit [Vreelandella populi]|uniref:Ubiquinol-cytochrome c reductase iron-sulfur subunit n=1 Tax=Vreelandella populi TaxID=2498858 RepID=A0A3S0WMI5_9GAMM|nr:ubiquinol-cytochrome c reductase iron-sulfur subunit [Halomonas populi]RUR42566.1 ubiquinol-cytochrome c reductase iron-sulfur subunit [Halomonas populi]RUR45831.1 ubiquinol-cytochrome c reductase iron-sulfur subunit [Halomonas populi]RUR57135.1 ubiquinol-cytochrome c reductase iron-sulfur subunit [Halomonas populi]
MADHGINKARRRFLVGATSVVGAVGVVGVAVPFVAAWKPSARARAAGAPVLIDISKLRPGQRITVEWRGRPVWIIRRTPEMIARTRALSPDILADPDSRQQQQPAYVSGELRSLKPEIGVLVGLCTHFGCSPLYRPEPDAAEPGSDEWSGGFYCPCHGSRFDLAGRVYTNMPAPTNLEVPPYRFLGDAIIELGEDGELS